jgi:hypothetical protein
MSSIDFTQGTLQSLLFHTITGRNYNHRLQWLVVGYGIYITLSKYFSYIVVVSFIGGGKQYLEKTTDLPQGIEKHYHIMLYQVHPT